MKQTKTISRKLKVIFLSIGNFLTTIVGLVSSIFLSRLLSIDEYANYRQTLLVYSFLAPLLSLGFDRAIYYNFEKRKDNHGEQILNVQYVILSIAFLFSVFFIIGGAGLISKLFHNPAIEKLIIIYSVFSIVNLPYKLLQPVLVIKEKVRLLTIFNIINKILAVLVVVAVAFLYQDASSIIISLLFVGVFTFVFIEILLLKNVSSIKDFSINKDIIKGYYRIGLPLLLASVMGIAGKNIDKLLISTIMTPIDFAIYANGAIEIPLIGAITGAVMVVILSDFTKLLNIGDIEKTFQLWNKAVEVTSSILIPLMFLLLLNADFLIVLMFGEKYADSALPFKIYLLLLPIRTMTFSSLITASGKTKLISKGALIFLISNILLSIFFIKTLGFTGPALATVLTTYFLGFYYSYHIAQEHNVSFWTVFSFNSMKLYLLLGTIALVVSNSLISVLKFNIFVNMIVCNVLFIIIFISGIIFFGKKKQYIELFAILKK